MAPDIRCHICLALLAFFIPDCSHLPLILGVVGFPNLQSSFNWLDYAKEHSQSEHKGSNPKGVPLNTFTLISPPLRDSVRFRVVEYLFDNHETVMPIVEVLNLTVFGIQWSALHRRIVKAESFLVLWVPLLHLRVVLRKEKRKGT